MGRGTPHTLPHRGLWILSTLHLPGLNIFLRLCFQHQDLLDKASKDPHVMKPGFGVNPQSFKTETLTLKIASLEISRM